MRKSGKRLPALRPMRGGSNAPHLRRRMGARTDTVRPAIRRSSTAPDGSYCRRSYPTNSVKATAKVLDPTRHVAPHREGDALSGIEDSCRSTQACDLAKHPFGHLERSRTVAGALRPRHCGCPTVRIGRQLLDPSGAVLRPTRLPRRSGEPSGPLILLHTLPDRRWQGLRLPCRLATGGP